MKRLLITGYKGFIGSYLYKRFKNEENLEVDGLGREFDLSRNEVLKKYDFIVHSAALSRPIKGIPAINYVFDNVLGTYNLLKNQKSARVVYLSSISVYGKVSVEILTEDAPITDPDIYGITKLLGEKVICDTELDSVILRLPGVLGKGAKTPWLSRVARGIFNNDEIPVYNLDAPFNNIVTLNMLYQIIRRVFQLMESGFLKGISIANVSADKPITIREVIKTVENFFGRKASLRTVEPKKSFIISNEKLKKTLMVDSLPPTRDLILEYLQAEFKQNT